MNRIFIAEYAAGAETPRRAIGGLTAAEMRAIPVPGTWSIQQIIMHLMDSDLIGSDRMKRIIAEDNPTLIGYDESRFAARLHYDTLDPLAACEVFRLNRKLTAMILSQLPDEDFLRTGMHNERGRVTLADQVHGYVIHLAHHMKFLRQKREMLGKPLNW